MPEVTPTLGEAIGLNYKIPSSAGAIKQIGDARKAEQASIASQQKARDRRLAALEKSQDKLSNWAIGEQSGLLPIDQEVAKALAQDVLEAAKSNDRDAVYQAQLELTKFTDSAKTSAKNLLTQGQTGISHPDKFTVKKYTGDDGEEYTFSDLANSKGTPENYAKWKKATGGTGYYISGHLDPIDKSTWLEDMQKNMVGSGLKYKSIMDPVTDKRKSLQAPSQEEIEVVWESAKTQSWFDKAMAQKLALGLEPEEAELQIKKTFITSIPKDVSARSMEKTGKSRDFSYDGNTVENDDVRIVVSDTDDRRIYNIAQIKTTENSNLDFARPKTADGKTPVVKGTPLRVEKLKDGQANIVVSVAEIVDGDKTGKFTEERVPYGLNKDRVLAGKLNFTIEDIDKGMTEKGVQAKSGDKFLQEKKINGKNMKIYQRADGSKYAK